MKGEGRLEIMQTLWLAVWRTNILDLGVIIVKPAFSIRESNEMSY